jgi:hypothetical protein
MLQNLNAPRNFRNIDTSGTSANIPENLGNIEPFLLLEDERRMSAVDLNTLANIRKHIGETTRPSWMNKPPKNLGEASHGKLKADEWRMCMEFDLPVSLAQQWSVTTDGLSHGEKLQQRRRDLLESTFLLASATRVASSHTTSELHAILYTNLMHKYLTSIKKLISTPKLRPNHHMALHLGKFLLRFGPMHGWWMFPFERVIGILQHINTNSRQGKESTCFQHKNSTFTEKQRRDGKNNAEGILRSFECQAIYHGP